MPGAFSQLAAGSSAGGYPGLGLPWFEPRGPGRGNSRGRRSTPRARVGTQALRARESRGGERFMSATNKAWQLADASQLPPGSEDCEWVSDLLRNVADTERV